MPKSPRITTAIVIAGLFLLCLASAWDLRAPYSDYLWKAQFQGFAHLLLTTAWGAFKVWSFWAIATAIAGLVLLRLDPELGLCDATIGGAACLWIFAYVGGNLLGPIGLFRSWTIWLIAIALVVWIARGPRSLRIHTPAIGAKLAILACLLMMISTIPMQLGSPVPPYMDVLNLPAAAQRIITFGRYLPFDNDPYGYWTPIAQSPGWELFSAFLGLGSHTRLALLAVTGSIVPMAALIILATYRLGRALMGDVAGGMAALLLFATTLLIRAEGMHGTSVAFAMVAIGLALFFDPDRRPIRTTIGVLSLAVAVATHAIDGGFAFATAGGIVLVRLLDEPRNALLELACLVGALLVTVPEFAVALQIKLPYPILPAAQLAGIAIIWFSAKALTPRRAGAAIVASIVERAIILAALVILAYRGPGIPFTMFDAFRALAILCMVGLAIASVSSGDRILGAYVAAMAILIAILAEHLAQSNLVAAYDTQAQFGIADVAYKLGEYWCPYFLVFPAALFFEWIYRQVSKPLAMAALLVLVVFPWSQHPELDMQYHEHSLAAEGAWEWQLAKQGWWGATGDVRWAQSDAELALSDKLRDEIRAGRITPETHIVHVTPHTIMWQDVLLFSVYTGINDDLYVENPAGPLDQGGTAGSRLYPMSRLPGAIAKRPPYIVVHNNPPAGSVDTAARLRRDFSRAQSAASFAATILRWARRPGRQRTDLSGVRCASRCGYSRERVAVPAEVAWQPSPQLELGLAFGAVLPS